MYTLLYYRHGLVVVVVGGGGGGLELVIFRRLTREFASAKTNAIEKYGEDLEKMK